MSQDALPDKQPEIRDADHASGGHEKRISAGLVLHVKKGALTDGSGPKPVPRPSLWERAKARFRKQT